MPVTAFSLADWLALLGHFASLSLLAVGGAITTAPDMHRYLVADQGWLSEAQFTSSIAIAQAAPGPNVLFVALMGWNVGVNAGGGVAAGWTAYAQGLLGLLVTMLGMLLPSTVVTYTATRWAHRNRQRLGVRAFKAGLAPLVVGLIFTTGWLLTLGSAPSPRDWPLWLLTAVTTVLVWRTRIHLLWLIAAGALLGALGWV